MEVHSLFPTPVGSFPLSKLSRDKLHLLLQQPKKTNEGNRTSSNRAILEIAEFKRFKNEITECLKQYSNTVIQHPTACQLYITQSWCNYTSKGEYHHIHHHPNSIVSGVYYIQTDNTDQIEFYKSICMEEPITINPVSFNEFNSASWWLPAKQSMLFLFPSRLKHSTLLEL